ELRRGVWIIRTEVHPVDAGRRVAVVSRVVERLTLGAVARQKTRRGCLPAARREPLTFAQTEGAHGTRLLAVVLLEVALPAFVELRIGAARDTANRAVDTPRDD